MRVTSSAAPPQANRDRVPRYPAGKDSVPLQTAVMAASGPSRKAGICFRARKARMWRLARV